MSAGSSARRSFTRARASSASSRACSSPCSETYVTLPAASSFPGVLPSSSAVPVASRMSSTIWKSRPSSSPNARQGASLVGREARDRDRARDRRAQQPAGLQRVQAPSPSASSSPSVVTSTYWPPIIPRVASASSRAGCGRRVAQHQPEGLGQERVAGEDGDVLAEAHVGARLAAPQVVVVERRQVVVDEAEGVDELERAGGGQQLAPGRARAPRRSRGRAPAGSASRRRGASSGAPPPARRARRRAAGGSARRRRARGARRVTSRGALPAGDGRSRPAPPWPGRRGSCRTSTARSGSPRSPRAVCGRLSSRSSSSCSRATDSGSCVLTFRLPCDLAEDSVHELGQRPPTHSVAQGERPRRSTPRPAPRPVELVERHAQDVALDAPSRSAGQSLEAALMRRVELLASRRRRPPPAPARTGRRSPS